MIYTNIIHKWYINDSVHKHEENEMWQEMTMTTNDLNFKNFFRGNILLNTFKSILKIQYITVTLGYVVVTTTVN